MHAIHPVGRHRPSDRPRGGVPAAGRLPDALRFPGQFAHLAREDPDDAYLRWPLTRSFHGPRRSCSVQVVDRVHLEAAGRCVRAGRIFSDEAHAGGSTIIGAIVAAWLLSSGGSPASSGSQADDPAAAVLFLLMVGGPLGLLMVVMRALLRQATALRTDMEAVI